MMGGAMKTCHKCKIEKNDSDFSESQLKSKYGQCKACAQKYYQDNKSHKLEYQKEYSKINKDEISKYKNEYWHENKEELYEYKKEWRKEYSNVLKRCDIHDIDYYTEECPICSGIRNKKYNQDHETEIREYNKLYSQEHKEEKNKYYRDRRKNDPIYNLRRVVSSSIYVMIKSQGSSKKRNSIVDFLPYSILEIKDHLERQFEPWMTWNNQGKYDSKTWKDDDPTTWTWQIDHIIPHSTFKYSSMEDDNFIKCWDLSNLRPYSAKQNLLDGANRVRH
jgi:hypothetical protein